MTVEEARRAGLALDYGFHETPFGEALFALAGDALAVLFFVNEEAGYSRADALRQIEDRWPFARLTERPQRTAALAAAIFSDPSCNVPVLLIGTPFEIGVWQATRTIPSGETCSYADIARRAGEPHAARAVGAALGRNVVGFLVPCHRVCRSDGTIGGFGSGLSRKRAMLDREAGPRAALG